MKFEEFERRIREMGYSIVCLNHYYQNNRRFTFCTILNITINKAFKAEKVRSEGVFDNLITQLEAQK